MSKLTTALARQWETVALYAMGLVLVVLLCLWLIGLGERAPTQLAAGAAPVQVSLLNQDTAFRFQEPLPQASFTGAHPFTFDSQLHARRPPRQGRDVPPPTNVTVAVRPPENPTARVPPAQPPPPKPQRRVQYLGTMTTPSGRTVGMLRDSTAGALLIEAGKEYEGLKVKGFSAKELTAVGPTGAELVIPFGQEAQVPLE